MSFKEHFLNDHQIVREVYDHEAGAIRTVPHSNQEFAIAISHEDNDTAGVVAVQKVVGEGTHSCVGMVRCCLYGTGTVSVSPSADGEDFCLVVDTVSAPNVLEIKQICAMRIRVIGDGVKVVMQGN